MSINRKIKFDTSRKENEEVLKNNFDKFKAKESSSINMKAPDLNSYKYPYSYDQPSADLIKFPLLKSPDFQYRASQLTEHLSFMTVEGNSLLQIQK